MTTLAERAVTRIATALSRRELSRRRFLFRSAVVGSALAVDPLRYLLRPQSAYATVCGSGNTCAGGWTAFCCTINDGANTCPEGSFAAGWWKVDQSAFCHDQPRYYIDCNRLPEARCSCTCADGECDQRRVCCNVFRYGQCNTHVPGVTEVVCRVITCTPPWEWDPACSATVRTDNRTASHSSTCLPGPYPSQIEIKYQDLGLTGSPLGAPEGSERDAPGGGRMRRYDRGIIAWRDKTGAHAVHGAAVAAFVDADGLAGPLGYPTTDVAAVGDGRGSEVRFEHGAIWYAEDTGAHAIHGPIHERYRGEGGASGWLGYPTSGVEDVTEGPWQLVTTENGWAVVRQTERDEVRILPSDAELSADGRWPRQVKVDRWAGEDRAATAAIIAQQAWADGADIAVIASQEDFADGLAGGVAAARLDGPLLLTARDRLHDATAQALRELGCRRAIVLGGPAAVSEQVVTSLRGLVDGVYRWGGEDRFGTAVRISRELFPQGAETVYVATGLDFADALAATPAAHRHDAPLLLTAPDRLPDATAAEVARLRCSRVVLLGGEAAIGTAVAQSLAGRVEHIERVSGPDRFATASRLAAQWDAGADTVLVATGEDFADALAGGAAAATLGAPILLVAHDRVPAATWDEYERHAPQRAILLGGNRAIQPVVGRQLGALLA